MTKAQIAQRAEIRWAQFQKILTGQRPQVSADTVRRLAQALNVSSDYLLGLTDDPTPRRNLRPRQKRSQAADEDEPAQAVAGEGRWSKGSRIAVSIDAQPSTSLPIPRMAPQLSEDKWP
jgi:transcriptional regulator with XRE-family HTH domain